MSLAYMELISNGRTPTTSIMESTLYVTSKKPPPNRRVKPEDPEELPDY